ncbi:MAG: 16S rRNA (adenine(1518)-N(6)/adenine(1519)-N(6))-dimethyltransferase RsmA [Candidatus Nomurabacteria bacterium]|nr:16S rRNA (adenine(1518)-N(6)/adenine(1519)-N(6))-dimethyltransferase RsmA [Candidatus Nomurabacteria bacterium]
MKAKKSLGQNFLKSIPALNKIVETGEISVGDIILEIGPGKGALTKQLLATSCQLIAVEKDEYLYELLKSKFEKEISSGQLKLIKGDILDFNIENYKLKAKTYKLIANIPYNITGAILKKFLQGNLSTPLKARNQPKLMVLMVQKEIAERIMARDGKESILSISVKAYGDPKMIMKVPARYFSPSPKVDSAIISIKNISRKNFNSPLEEYPLGGGGQLFHPGINATPQEGNVDERVFWEIVRAGFAHKRKKLSSNLKKYDPSLSGGVASVGLGNKRAEELTLKDWIELVKVL